MLPCNRSRFLCFKNSKIIWGENLASKYIKASPSPRLLSVLRCESVAIHSLFVDDPIRLFCVLSLFCCMVFGVLSSLGITLLRKREIFAEFQMCQICLCSVFLLQGVVVWP